MHDPPRNAAFTGAELTRGLVKAGSVVLPQPRADGAPIMSAQRFGVE